MRNEIIIISLGGSLIVPDQIDIEFLKGFKKIIEGQIKRGKRFIIICGGGKTARIYQNAARETTKLTREDIDWIGIHATRMNGQLVKAMFKKYAHTKVIKDPNKKVIFKEKILIAAGAKPGCSTDYDAVLLAKQLGIKKMVNLSNIDYVYDKDPRKFTDAVPIRSISWAEFRKLLPKDWDPGLHMPFDPVASKEAEKIGLEVSIVNGRKLKNLENYFAGKKFIGTKVTN